MYHDIKLKSSNNFEYFEVPVNCISRYLEICPKCSDTKTVTTPAQTIKCIPNPPYRTECTKCKIWWETRKEEFKNGI